ncbi:MAG: TIGR03643 family protein [Bacteroidota bacterium]
MEIENAEKTTHSLESPIPTPQYASHLDLSEDQVSRVIEMAWEDRTPFSAIAFQFGLAEKQVIELMRYHLRKGSFRRWRRHVTGRKAKHSKLRSEDIKRFKSKAQRHISHNRPSKPK